MSLMKSLGRRLRQLRTARKMSVIDVAGAVETDRTHLHRCERGACRPSIELLERLAFMYEVDFADLWVFPSEHARHRLRDLVGRLTNDDVPRAIHLVEPMVAEEEKRAAREAKRPKRPKP